VTFENFHFKINHNDPFLESVENKIAQMGLGNGFFGEKNIEIMPGSNFDRG